jgi:hypothetical protein
VEEALASSPQKAPQRAAGIGFPVVLKGLGARLDPQEGTGLVHLNLEGMRRRSSGRPNGGCLGGRRPGGVPHPADAPYAANSWRAFHDAQFGPVVMFGLGGVFTEASTTSSFASAL